MTIHVMCGLPGSGKTTLSQELTKEYDAVLYCYDEMPKAYRVNETHKMLFYKILKDLKSNKTVIYDDLNITKKEREKLL